MKKRMIALLLGAILVWSFTLPTLAQPRNGLYILDEKEYLQETVWNSYQIQAKELSDELNMDILYVQTYERDLQTDAQTLNMGSRPDQIMLLDNDGMCDIVLFGAACALTEDHVQQLRDAYILKPTYTEGISAYLQTAEQIVTELNESGVLDLYRDLPQFTSRLGDQGKLLHEDEEESLLAQLDQISQQFQMDVVVVSVSGLEGQNAQDYAASIFQNNEYGMGTEHDGVLLLINAEDRSWHLHTSGHGTTVFTDEALSYVADHVAPKLREEAYSSGIQIFIDMCQNTIAKAGAPSPAGEESQPGQRFPLGKYLLISIVIGGIAASLIVFHLRRQLKSQKIETVATLEPKLTVDKDIFLYSTSTSRQKRKSGNGSARSN